MPRDEKPARHLMITSDSGSAICPRAGERQRGGKGSNTATRTGNERKESEKRLMKKEKQVSTGSREKEGMGVNN